MSELPETVELPWTAIPKPRTGLRNGTAATYLHSAEDSQSVPALKLGLVGHTEGACSKGQGTCHAKPGFGRGRRATSTPRPADREQTRNPLSTQQHHCRARQFRRIRGDGPRCRHARLPGGVRAESHTPRRPSWTACISLTAPSRPRLEQTAGRAAGNLPRLKREGLAHRGFSYTQR